MAKKAIMKQLYKTINESIGMLQEEEEVIWAAEMAMEHLGGTAKTFVEFGSYNGGSFAFYSMAIAAKDACCIAIDPQLHEGAFQGDKITELYQDRELYWFIESSSLVCADKLQSFLCGELVEVAHIDSIHLASHTEQEWAILKPLMSSPSVLIVHDIKPGWRQSNYPGYLGEDIRQLSTGDWWQRIKFDYSYVEKKINGPHPDMGVGLLLL